MIFLANEKNSASVTSDTVRRDLMNRTSHRKVRSLTAPVNITAALGAGVSATAASASISYSSFNNDYHGHSISLGETHAWTEHDTTGYMHASADIAAMSTAQCADTHTARSSTAHAHCDTSFQRITPQQSPHWVPPRPPRPVTSAAILRNPEKGQFSP